MIESGGPWIQTFTGKAFDLHSPQIHQIDIIDIAHALARTNRFNGHSSRAYSVAEHSRHVARITIRLGYPELALQALLHDAAEAYVGDVAAPLKKMLIGYKEIEDRVQRAINIKFRLDRHPNENIKHADRIALATEKEYLMKPQPESIQHQWQTLPPPDAEEIQSYQTISSECEEMMFLEDFYKWAHLTTEK